MTREELTEIRAKHRAYMRKWTDEGRPVAQYDCPACGDVVTTTHPKRGDGPWSSLRTCPGCGEAAYVAIKWKGPAEVVALETVVAP